MINVASKRNTNDYNQLLTSYLVHIDKELAKFSVKDLILILSSIGFRQSNNMIGSHDLIKSDVVMGSIRSIANVFVQKK